MKVLLVGGTGVISTAVSAEAISRGMELWVLNRGLHASRLAAGANSLVADYENEAQVKEVLADHVFDTVVDFRTFTVAQIEKAIRVFTGHTKQYIFISSGTVYKKPLEHYLITEDAPLGNIHSAYARNKLACEWTLRRAIDKGFPGVIVRPSLTYSDFNLLTAMNSRKDPYTLVHRMRKNKPVVVHGDGTSLWTLTWNEDFAKAFIGLLGNPHAIGEAFQITSDESVTWNQIHQCVADALGVEFKPYYVASDLLDALSHYDFKGGLIGDKANSVVFDNTKVKNAVPGFVCTTRMETGIRKTVEYMLAHPETQVEDPEFDAWCDKVIAKLEQLQEEF